jgi:DNA repair exonuclease SbcCD nuclease subunit
VLPDPILIVDKQENDGYITDLGNTSFFFAPHCLSQQGYDTMIEGLRQEAEACNKYRVLCLHCNYNLSEHIVSETSLNLSEERAIELLGTFHYILVGHIHTGADYFDGRLKVVGSVFPTAFDNLDDKRALLYDTETGQFTDLLLWTKLLESVECPASLVHLSDATPVEIQYFDLEDDLPAGEAQKLAVNLLKNGAFGVRVRPKKLEESAPATEISISQFGRLPETISQEIQSEKPHLFALWTELRSGL